VSPTDRAKSGTKRSILVDGHGVPLGLSVDAANKYNMKMTNEATLQSIVVHRPEPTTTRIKQHMCMDNGYDFPEVYEFLKTMIILFI